MDAHPTPFPGKRRIGAKSAGRNGDGVKPPWQTVTAAQPRPKRAFGVARSTNVPVERPLLTSKPRKIPAAVRNPSNPRTVTTTTTKKHQVSFQDPQTVVPNLSEKGGLEAAVRTPISSIKPAVPGTPYLSAQGCSKCRLDKLESSTYWLAQIRLAESTGKHFVAAAFFRLALECHAQPFHKLRSELRHYVTRHQVNSTESVWIDLSQAYGLAKGKMDSDLCDIVQNNSLLAEMNDSIEKPDADSCRVDQSHVSLVEMDDSELDFHAESLSCKAHKDGCSEHDNLDGAQVDKSFHDAAKLKDNHGDKEESGSMVLKENPEIDSLTGNNSRNVANISCSTNKPPEGKLSIRKSSGGDSTKSSSQKVKTPTSCPSTGKGREMLMGNQEKSKASANNSIRSNDGRSRRNRSDQITGKNKEDENEKPASKELSMRIQVGPSIKRSLLQEDH